VYVSTACVFYGDRGFYAEDDIPRPKNFYGLTKLLGEYVARRIPAHLIVRTNFVPREPWPYPKAFVDRFGTYLYTDDVARAVSEVLSQQLTGLVHIAGDKRLSMLELARMTTPLIEPMSVQEVTLPLTADVTLTSTRISPYRLTGTESPPRP
jgi:dTDP-4-dehydrorhamnose reductase